MTKIVILFVSLHLSTFLFSQAMELIDMPPNSCEGAVNIFNNGTFSLEFTGDNGEPYIAGYPSLSNVTEENTLWCSYIANEDGELSFTASTESEYLQMVVFQQEEKGICEELRNGYAEIKRLNIKKETKTMGLGYEVNDSYMYALKLNEGDKINILFNTVEKSTEKLSLDWNFIPTSNENNIKIVDKRDDDIGTTLSFKIIDRDSKKPIIASLVIEGGKNINGLYTGSEFYFNLNRSGELNVKCDVEGYFFEDSLYAVKSFLDKEIIISMKRVSSGEKIIIEEIEFNAGTSEITEKSIPNLVRLKDFLVLNSSVHIEIQGHVFRVGKNTIASQRVSEARAKRVMKYLIANGIDKDRLTAVGFGNTKPVFEKPQFAYEEQANRRVEILIK